MEKYEIVFYVILGIVCLALFGAIILPLTIRLAREAWAVAFAY